MSISRSQKFVYFQNKAKHYHQLRNIKSSIDHSPPKAVIPKPKVFKPLPFNKRYQIQVQNQHLIDRLVNIAKCQRTQVAADGLYSRFNRVDRPFRDQIPFKNQQQRVITIDNSDIKKRVKSVKPVVGSTNFWSNQYGKFLDNKKNISRYMDNHKSKAELHISTDNFLPQHLRDFKDHALKKQISHLSASGKDNAVPIQKLLQLPYLPKRQKKLSLQNSTLKRQQSITELQVQK